MTNIEEQNIQRLQVPDRWNPDNDSKFCLAQLYGYESDSPQNEEKIADLLAGRIDDERSDANLVYACNLGGCTLQLAIGPDVGRRFSGECRAANYCLKQSFEAVGKAPTVAEGKELYGDIMDSLDGFTSSQSAGNFCPRLECELSAGVSVDMVPGTAGTCHIGGLIDHPQLPLEGES